MKRFLVLFSLTVVLLFCSTTNAASSSEVFKAYGEYRKNMTSGITNGTTALLQLKEYLDVANKSVFEDISILSTWQMKYSANLTSLEAEAQNQNLSISDCVAIHNFMNSYVTQGLATLNKKWNLFYSSKLETVNSLIDNGMSVLFSYQSEDIFLDLSLCDNDSTCLDSVIRYINGNCTENLNTIQSTVKQYVLSYPTDLEDTASEIADLLFDGLREVVVVYKTALSCLENAGLDS